MRFFVLIFSAIIAKQSFGLETDQFVSLNVQLNDSHQLVSDFINSKAELVMDQINASEEVTDSCEEVHERIIKWHTRKETVIVAIEAWAYVDAAVDRYPPTAGVDRVAVVDRTIYSGNKSVESTIFGITININGIYLGIDKLAHFIETSYYYYDEYVKELRKSGDHQSALKAAFDFGIRSEKTFYGYWLVGVFSHADLEANYRGFLMQLDFCKEKNPIIRKAGNQWVLNKPIDIRDYVTPYMDESYHPNAYKNRLFRKIKDNMAKYCWARYSRNVLNRFRYYSDNFNPISEHSIYVDKLIRKGELRDPKLTSLETLCSKPSTYDGLNLVDHSIGLSH